MLPAQLATKSLISSLSEADRAALFLYEWRRYEDLYEVPFGVTQEGLAEGTSIHRGNIPRALKVLRDSSYLRERKAYVRGTKRKRKVYFLTPEGCQHSMNLRKELEASEVVVRDLDGEFKVAQLSSVPEFQSKAFSLLEAINRVKEAGSLDRRSIIEERGYGKTRLIRLKEIELDDTLRSLKESGSVRFATVATRQGLLIASRGSFHMDATLTAAVITALALSAEKAAHKMNVSAVRQIIVEGREGNIVVRGVGEKAILAVLLEPEANLGLISMALDDCAERLRGVLEE